ncbi:hypothetical protein OSTOST_13390, partial [Ostertagia ostertagi]
MNQLKKNGDFLLRLAHGDSGKSSTVYVSVKWDVLCEFPINSKGSHAARKFSIDGKNEFPLIMEVVRYHHTNSVPVSRDILLKTPISKERWELTKDKVTLDTKIGEGAFGEVWKGTLKEDPSKPPIDVAVKV